MRKLPIKEQDKKKRFVQFCNLLQLSIAKEFDHLPDRLKVLYHCMDYETIVKPLIRYDYYSKSKPPSKRNLARRYKKSRPFIDKAVA